MSEAKQQLTPSRPACVQHVGHARVGGDDDDDDGDGSDGGGGFRAWCWMEAGVATDRHERQAHDKFAKT